MWGRCEGNGEKGGRNDLLVGRPTRVRPSTTQGDSRIAPTATVVATIPAGLPMAGD